MPKTPDLLRQRFGRLTVLRREGSDKNWHALWACRCDCGTEIVTRTQALSQGKAQSCGCLRKERAAAFHRARLLTHGQAPKSGFTRLYRIWAGMKARCADARNKYYGARGIRVCDEWQSFEAFRDWAIANGYRADLSIDRRDSDGNYGPGNCWWATKADQAKNRGKH